MPAVIERDLDSFGSSINQIQNTGFKKIELDLQDPIINEIIENMISEGAAGVGMSSFGPTVYAIADENIKSISKAAKSTMKDVGGKVIITKAWNKGFTIK
jgi:beta-ribofuranosylaminobenzene 5'-phosphate synthase